MNPPDHLLELVNTLPTECCELVFSYGSGAVAQKGQDPRKNMADFVVVVSDAEKFHQLNMKGNKFHYSAIRLFGPIWSAHFQRNFGAQIYYNTLIKVPPSGRLMKYGVIETSDLIADLLDWEYLYISGRLHKPIVMVKWTNYEPLINALDFNIRSAVHAALLLLPETFSAVQFYEKIAGLSYSGDFRSLIGEDKNKVTNIVQAQLDKFEILYGPILDQSAQIYVEEGGRISQDLSIEAVYHHLNLLPKRVLWNLQSDWNRRIGKNSDLEEVVFAMAHNRLYPEAVNRSIKRIVASSSIRQSAKNIATAGFTKTLVYSMQKLRKMIMSLR